MSSALADDTRPAMRGAFAGAALFIALIVVFSAAGGDGPPAGTFLLVGAVLGAFSHLVLLPVVAVLPAPAWARPAGYAWIGIDVMLNVASLNGADPSLIASLRLGGHVSAATWMALAAWHMSGVVRAIGVFLGALLLLHAFASPWLAVWAIFIPFLLVPVWLALVGRYLLSRP